MAYLSPEALARGSRRELVVAGVTRLPPGPAPMAAVQAVQRGQGRLYRPLSDAEWRAIAPLLPRNWRGLPRTDDRPVLDGVFWRFTTDSPWITMPRHFGAPTTCYNRFVRWRRRGLWNAILAALPERKSELEVMLAPPVHRFEVQEARADSRGAGQRGSVPYSGSGSLCL